jgi:dihydrofolate reductase
MRKLKLQMQVTVDGYVAGPQGELDWMTFDMDPGLLAFINQLTDTSDTILLGRKMTDGFVKYWEHAATLKDSPEYDFAQKMVGLPKVVFSRTVKHVEGKNVHVENRDLAGAVNQLKSQPGKDIVVYGGATFVSSLVEHLLIDEMNLFVNPVAIGSGLQIFKGKTPLKLAASTAYPSGIVVNSYLPA